MTQILRLGTFVAGPEPEGRGYGLIAHSGLTSDAGWRGNMPLVLLEWANRRSRQPFCGRFPVAGGVIAIRAAYFHQGSAGPVARAFGVFVDEASLRAYLNAERQIFAALPAPTLDDDFGRRPFEVEVPADSPVYPWPYLGLGWRDRQLFVSGPAALEDIVFAALSSIDPPGQRARVRGWSTTGLLAGRGDFLPISNCNLLVTHPDEPLAHARFVVAHVERPPHFEGEKIEPPDNFHFWHQLRDNLLSIDAGIGEAMAWQADMADQDIESLAWRSVEVMSQRRFTYADTVAAIVAMGGLPGEGRTQASAATMQKYLEAIDKLDAKMLPDVRKLFADVSRNQQDISGPDMQRALDSSTLSLLNPVLAEQLDDAALLRVIAVLAGQASAVSGDAGRLELLDDESVWRAFNRNLRSAPTGEGERRKYLGSIRARQGLLPVAARASTDPGQRHKLLLRRLAMQR